MKEAGIRIGVSACLLGRPVRYDGGHKLDHFLVDTLGPHVEFLPVCPEAELGLGVPREPMRLSGDPARPSLVVIRDGTDLTDRMIAFAANRVEALADEDLHGFVLKSRSPSCGTSGVSVFGREGEEVSGEGSGIFVRILAERLPLLPIENEVRLRDVRVRDDFMERVFVHRRWSACLRDDSPSALIDFHERHKLIFMARSPAGQHELGSIVGEAGAKADGVAAYRRKLAEVMRTPTTAGRHENVLLHALGYFKDALDGGERAELVAAIGRFKRGEVPRLVPVTLLDHYARLLGESYLARQYYLRPDPVELMLRCHA